MNLELWAQIKFWTCPLPGSKKTLPWAERFVVVKLPLFKLTKNDLTLLTNSCCFSSQFWKLSLTFKHTIQHICLLFLFCPCQAPWVIHNVPEYTASSISWQISSLAGHQQWQTILNKVHFAEPFCTECDDCCRLWLIDVDISSWYKMPNRQTACIDIWMTTISVSWPVLRVNGWHCMNVFVI